MSFIIFLPGNITVPAEKNKTILDIALENDIPLEHNCGGTCSCISCIVYIKNNRGFFNEISGEENEQITESGLKRDGLRLACMAELISLPNHNTEIEIIKTENDRED